MAALLRSSSSPSTLLVVGLVALAVGAACSSSDPDANNSGSSGNAGNSGNATGSQVASTSDCTTRCDAKFKTCGVPGCSPNVCDGTVTADQLSCLEKATCEEISAASSFATLCPTGSGSTGNGSTGNGSTGESTLKAGPCGDATCTATEYCSYAYDDAKDDWVLSGCKTAPVACATKGPDDICDCMNEKLNCPKGTPHTRSMCGQPDGALSFGCD